jgi:hypothetical protein
MPLRSYCSGLGSMYIGLYYDEVRYTTEAVRDKYVAQSALLRVWEKSGKTNPTLVLRVQS